MPSHNYPNGAGGGGGGGGGGGCEIDVEGYPGADLGAKLQAAIDALPATGGVLTCECLTGAQTISSTVTIDKPVKIKFGASVITCSASPSIHMAFLSDLVGSVVVGAGIGVTKFQAAGGITPIFLVECDNAIVQDLEVAYTGGNASNIGMLIRQGASVFGRIHPHISNILFFGSGGTGDGMQFEVVFGGLVTGCELREWNNGIHTLPGVVGSVNAVLLEANRLFLNNTGILMESTGDQPMVGNRIEGNVNYGIRVVDAFNVNSVADHIEQISPAVNVRFEGVSGVAPRDHTFSHVFFSGPSVVSSDIVVAAGGIINVYLFGGVALRGFTHSGSGSISLHDVDNVGTNVGNVIFQYENEWKGVATKNLRLYAWQTVRIESTVEVNPLSDPAVDFIIRGSSDSFLYNVDSSIDASGIGAVATAGIKLNIGLTSTAVSGTSRAVSVLYTANPTANSTADNAAIVATGQSQAGNIRDFSFLRGGVVSAIHSGSGTSASTRGLEIAAFNSGAGTSTDLTGIIVSIVQDGAGTTTASNGIFVAAPTRSAGVMSAYTGITIARPTAAASNAALNVIGGDSYFNQGLAGGDVVMFGTGDSYPGNLSFFMTSSTGRVNIGGSTPTLGKFQVSETVVVNTGTRVSSYVSTTVTPTALSNGNYTALGADMVAGSGFNVTGSVLGVGGAAYWTSANTLSFLYGGQFQAILSGSGTVTDAEALRCRVQNTGSGTIANGNGFVIDTPINSGGGAITTQIQLLIFESTVAGSNFSVYVTGGMVELNANGSAGGDLWNRGQTVTYGLYFDASAAYLGLGTNAPSTLLHAVEAFTLTGNVADAFSAAITQEPGYSATFTVDRHNYQNILNVVTVSGSPTITDACIWRFNAAAGTHKAVDSGTTKTTPGTVNAWPKINIDGTIHYIPAYTSKTT